MNFTDTRIFYIIRSIFSIRSSTLDNLLAMWNTRAYVISLMKRRVDGRTVCA